MIEDKDNKEEINLSGVIIGAPDRPDVSVKFKDEEQMPNQIFNPETPKMVKWIIRYSGGLIKNEKQANYVLLGFVALVIIFLLFSFFSRSKAPKIRVEDFKNKQQFLP